MPARDMHPGEIADYIQTVCDAPMKYVRDNADGRGVNALCVDFDGVIAQIPNVTCQFEGDSDADPDIVGRDRGDPVPAKHVLANYRIGNLLVAVLEERALAWARCLRGTATQ
jgi:hypothetical protein